jgi:hypothetical protein
MSDIEIVPVSQAPKWGDEGIVPAGTVFRGGEVAEDVSSAVEAKNIVSSLEALFAEAEQSKNWRGV